MSMVFPYRESESYQKYAEISSENKRSVPKIMEFQKKIAFLEKKHYPGNKTLVFAKSLGITNSSTEQKVKVKIRLSLFIPVLDSR
jgi:hypothetical protein